MPSSRSASPGDRADGPVLHGGEARTAHRDDLPGRHRDIHIDVCIDVVALEDMVDHGAA